ncbi:LD-carboxypeptidase [Paenibacillus sp. Marseille-Q4541]|uniref:S66 peptidase family protein n=1 Tax=Paenibacillus sp. Marseille-Q4541 TaxID=2831522 RepID=UPI001BA89B96|nr:LD-carboxypeptidase [Paenibacillus sp. Marseille-Q4541]
MNVVLPKKLYSGDLIGITAPASFGDPVEMERAAGYLIQLGLRVELGHSLYRQHGYLAGTDEERARELNDMFRNPEIKAIICARGGYGTARIVDLLDYETIKANPKIFWGFSDITFLHQAIYKQTGLVTFHGPMLTSLCAESLHPFTLSGFHQLFHPTPVQYTEDISELTTLVEGTASGVVVGGNLSLIVSSLGTPHEIDTKDRLLLMEDIDEEPYRIDRMLNQLLQAGKLKDAAGIIVGDFHECEPQRKISFSLEEVIIHYLKKAGKPALAGFCIGHCSPNIAIPLGLEAELSTADKTLIWRGPAVTE